MNFPLYIDPGTGSMLFSLFIGVAAAATFGVRALFLKLKFIFSGGKADSKADAKNIPFVIFSDHKRYWNVFKPICDEFEKRGVDLTFYTASPDDPALSCDYKHIHREYLGEKNKPYAKLNLLHADILVATTPNLGVFQWKKSKFVKCYVHIPHSADELAGYRMFGLDHYDAVLTTGKNQNELIKKMEELRPNTERKEIVSVGSLTLDNLKHHLDSSGSNNSEKKERKVVLVAPSWGESGILSRYGEKFLSALKNTDYEIIVRPHPQTVVSEQGILKPLQEKFSDFDWNFDNDNFEVMNKSDVLITDFSGIIFDYACVFDRPLIYADTSFDTLPYDADWLSEPRWSFKVLPEIGLELKEADFDKIGTVISNAVSSKVLADGRKKVRSECWENIGNSAAATADWLIKKHDEILKV